MTRTQTHHPITNAVVARIRAVGRPAALEALKGIYQGVAPEKTEYPFVVYNLAAAPYDYLFGDDTTLIAMIDLTVYSRKSIEAEDLDAALAGWLSDQSLPVTGQTTLLCRRVATIPTSPDVDDEGNVIYSWGGTYEVQTDAPPLA
ncbi:MAG TPA: hypothetical protein VFX15_02910 [Actinomycetes bacterium]|nr:hypothetical protein [Actinomycetes bacterium]